MNNASPVYTLGQISTLLKLECHGDADSTITGIATLASASKGQLSFLANPRYQSELLHTSASAVIVAQDMVDQCPCNSLVSNNPYLSYAEASQLFCAAGVKEPFIHPCAVISESANVSKTASIAANAVIGEGAIVGENSIVGSGCVIGDNTVIGEDCLLHANVTIYHNVQIGDRVILHSGTVIGSDGFGFAPSGQANNDAKNWIKIHQLGGVVIGNDVEIGANSAIDRGALDNTVIGNGVIIDNLVQIAHNVVIGDNTAIAGCTGIAGSSKIGRNCTIAGRASILGHLTIADGTHITTNSIVSKSIRNPGSYSSGTGGVQETKKWRKNAVRFSQLSDIYRRLVKLEKRPKDS